MGCNGCPYYAIEGEWGTCKFAGNGKYVPNCEVEFEEMMGEISRELDEAVWKEVA